MNTAMLRIELRRNTVLLLLPAMAVLFWFSPTQRHLSALALWPDRSIDMQTALQGVGPLFAGAAAWMAGRERRRRMADLLTTTPRSTWARLLTTWAATALWGLLFYALVGVVVLGDAALRATWGAPVPWPVLVGLLAMTAFSTLGFALGYHIPSRFTAPFVAVGVFVSFFAGFTLLDFGDKAGYLAAIYPSVTSADSLWYADRPDLGLVQALFLLGLIGASLGSLGFSGRGRMLVPDTLRAAVSLTAAGLALVVASVALVMGSTVDQGMVRVPLFGGSAANVPVAYTPVCAPGPLSVCVHPAYRAQLDETAALVNRLAAPVLGLPGAPVRAAQGPSTTGVVTRGTQRVLAFTPIDFHDPTNPPRLTASWTGQLAVSLVANTFSAGSQFWTTNKAQTVVALYVLQQAGARYNPREFEQGSAVTAAERRFSALDPRTRRRWLLSHYMLLRAGRVRLEDLP